MASKEKELIKSTVQAVNKQKKEKLDSSKYKENMDKTRDALYQVFCGKKKDPEGSQTIQVFLKEDPLIGAKRMIEMRRHKDFDLDDRSSYLAFIYRFLMGAIVNSTTLRVQAGKDGAEYYLKGGVIKLILDELRTEEFRSKRNSSKKDSLIAATIGNFLTLITNIYNYKTLQLVVGEELHENHFYEALEPYAICEYAALMTVSSVGRGGDAGTPPPTKSEKLL